MPKFLITGENVTEQAFDQEKIRIIKPLHFGLEVHFTNGRVIIIDAHTTNLNFKELAEEANNDLKLKRSTGIHTYWDHLDGYQVYINNDRYD